MKKHAHFFENISYFLVEYFDVKTGFNRIIFRENC